MYIDQNFKTDKSLVMNKITNKIKIPAKANQNKIEKFFIDNKLGELVKLSKLSRPLSVNQIVSNKDNEIMNRILQLHRKELFQKDVSLKKIRTKRI